MHEKTHISTTKHKIPQQLPRKTVYAHNKMQQFSIRHLANFELLLRLGRQPDFCIRSFLAIKFKNWVSHAPKWHFAFF